MSKKNKIHQIVKLCKKEIKAIIEALENYYM